MLLRRIPVAGYGNQRSLSGYSMYPGVPLHVEYELTERGRNLQPIFAAMWAWVQENDLSPERGAEEMGQ